MPLYVDGVAVGTNPQTPAQSYTGYWKVGGDNTWGGASSNYFAGTVDEVAVYSSELTPAQVTAHYKASGAAVNAQPAALCLLLLCFPAASQVLEVLDVRKLRQVFEAELHQELFRGAVHHRAADRLLATLGDDEALVEQSLDGG